MPKHSCPTCGQTCREAAKPKASKVIDLDALMAKRYKGACPVCKDKSYHQPDCALNAEQRRRMLAWQVEQQRLRAAGVDTMKTDLSWLTPPIPYHKDRVVGCVLFANKADAQAMRDRQIDYERDRDLARVAHNEWTLRWKAAAAAAEPSVALLPDPKALPVAA